MVWAHLGKMMAPARGWSSILLLTAIFMKKYLDKEDLYLVKPKFREMAKLALDCGECVPYSIIYLSDAPLTESEIEQVQDFIRRHKLSYI